jgi:hypothetical protein
MRSIVMTFRVSPAEAKLARLVARFLGLRPSHWIRELTICGAAGVLEMDQAGELFKTVDRDKLLQRIRSALAKVQPDRLPE